MREPPIWAAYRPWPFVRRSGRSGHSVPKVLPEGSPGPDLRHLAAAPLQFGAGGIPARAAVCAGAARLGQRQASGSFSRRSKHPPAGPHGEVSYTERRDAAAWSWIAALDTIARAAGKRDLGLTAMPIRGRLALARLPRVSMVGTDAPVSVVKAVNGAARFLLELCALAALGYWGFYAGSGAAERIALAIGMPVVAAVAWGVFGAPGSARQLHRPWRLGLELVIFGGAAAGLFAAGQHALALAFVAVVLVNGILLFLLGQAGGRN